MDHVKVHKDDGLPELALSPGRIDDKELHGHIGIPVVSVVEHGGIEIDGVPGIDLVIELKIAHSIIEFHEVQLDLELLVLINGLVLQ